MVPDPRGEPERLVRACLWCPGQSGGALFADIPDRSVARSGADPEAEPTMYHFMWYIAEKSGNPG